MKHAKHGHCFRLDLLTEATLNVISRTTGATMTEILQECVRIGKKTVARNRHLIYSDLLLQIEMEMNGIKASRRKGGRSLDSTTENITTKNAIEIAQTKWLEDD